MTDSIGAAAKPLEILYEDNHCLAVIKPAKLLTAGDSTGDDTLLERAKLYLKRKYQKPGAVYLGLVQRLDRPTSGVVLFARTSKSAARIAKQFRDSSVKKTYLAVVEGNMPQRQAELVDWLHKDEHENLVSVVSPETPGAKQAKLTYRVLQTEGDRQLLEIKPQTGRSHQIRVQLASRGCPIIGDRKYGASRGWGGRIALHAASLSFEHPTLKENITIEAPPTTEFNNWITANSKK